MKYLWASFILLSLAPPFASLPKALAQTEGDLLKQLQSSDAKAREKAAQELGKRGDNSAVPALARALSDPSDKVRREVIVALSEIHAPQSLDALVTATRDTDSDLRVLAIQGVVGYYTGQALYTGFTGFFKKNWQRAKSHYEMDTARIDPGVLVDPKVVSALDAAMMDSRLIESARAAARGLGILVAQPAIGDLVKSAHSSDEDLARESLNALSKIKDPSAGPKLVDLLDSPDKLVKQDAAVTTGILRNHDALPKLQAMYENNPDKKTREKALEGIAYLGDPVSVPLLTKALWSQEKVVRTTAAEGLARAGDPKTLPELEKAVAPEKDAYARLAMEFAITAVGKQDYLSALVGELGSKFHANVAQSYLVELSRNSAFLPKLYPYLANQEVAVRERLCTVLMYTGDATSIAPLEQASHDKNLDVASESVRALRAIRLRVSHSSPTPTPAHAPPRLPI